VQLGKYKLIRKLGRGGMGEVWEGLLDGEHGFERRVAIKCMAASGQAWEHRFLDEARIASRLHHANIVQVLDFGTSGETWFQVLELIPGIDAHQLMDRAFEQDPAGVPIGLALHICAEVAHGLSAAHTALDEQGRSLRIVHRDVSLDNMLVSWAGDVKLSDFGVAKAANQAHQTIAGSMVGKISYMAPEQATAGDIDARADLFALGCALHALLTRRTPLADESAMMELLSGKPLTLAPSLPQDVATLIAKAVQRSRTQRFQSAAEMADALARARYQRLSEDPRTALAKYLGQFRPTQRVPRAGMLDGLLAPEVTGSPNTLDQRTPQNSMTLTNRFDAPPPGALDKTAQTPLVRRRRAPLFAAAAGVLTAAAGVTAYATLSARPQEPAPQPVVVEHKAEPQPAPAPAPAPIPEPGPAPAAVVVETAKPAPAVKKRDAPRPAPAAAPVGQGIVAVGGPKAQRAEILVDGKSEGYAPKRLELSTGPHEIMLLAPSGERIGPHRVDVTLLNTELEPLKWIVE
jgi:serine/threonine protein kinase